MTKFFKRFYELPIITALIFFLIGTLYGQYSAYGMEKFLRSIIAWQSIWGIAGAAVLAFMTIHAARVHEYLKDQREVRRKVFVDTVTMGTIAVWARGFAEHSMEAFKKDKIPYADELPTFPNGAMNVVGAYVGPHSIFLFMEIIEKVELLTLPTISKNERHAAIGRLYLIADQFHKWCKDIHDGKPIKDFCETDWVVTKFPDGYQRKIHK